MAVSFISGTKSVRTATTDPWDISVTIDAGCKGVVVLIGHSAASTDFVTSVDFVSGGSFARVTTNVDSATEPMRSYIYFLGSSIPTGAQTVRVDLTSATTNDIMFEVVQLGGSADLEVVDFDGVSGDATNPSVTLSYAGRTCISVGSLVSGVAAPASASPNGNMSAIDSQDLGNQAWRADRQTTPGTSDFTFSYTASNDDCALSVAAIAEVAASNILCTPTTAALTLTTYAPTVRAPRLATPTTASLTTATFAPTVSVSDNQSVTPTTASLTTQTFAPTVSATANVLATPTTAALVTETFAPTVTTPRLVTPTTATLTLSAFAPTVSAPRLATPTTASLTIETFAPTVTATSGSDVTVTPSTAALVLSAFAPTVTTPRLATPTTAELLLAAFAPTVTATANVEVTPGPLALTLTGYAPTVTGDVGEDTPAWSGSNVNPNLFGPVSLPPRPVVVTPRPASIGLLTHAPAVLIRPSPSYLAALGVI